MTNLFPSGLRVVRVAPGPLSAVGGLSTASDKLSLERANDALERCQRVGMERGTNLRRGL